MIQWNDKLQLWVAILLAIAVKILISEQTSWGKLLTTVVSGIFAAWIFAPPVFDQIERNFGLDEEVYFAAIAALIAITGENLMRLLLKLVENPEKLIVVLKLWRGR